MASSLPNSISADLGEGCFYTHGSGARVASLHLPIFMSVEVLNKSNIRRNVKKKEKKKKQTDYVNLWSHLPSPS